MKSHLFAACLLLTFSAYAQDARYSFKESFELPAPAQVSISSSDGDIEVVTLNGTKTDVFFIVKKQNKVLNMKRAALEKELELTVEHSGNALTIVVKHRNQFNVMDWRDRIVVSFRVQTPPATACDLRTSDGNVGLSGLRSDQKVRTSDGNLNIENVQGSVYASTSDGNITAKNITGRLEAKTSDGDIRLSDISAGIMASTSDGNITIGKSSGDIRVKTSDGNISFQDLQGSLTASTSDGNIKGNLVKLTKELDARTSDGNIVITVPSNLGLDLDIKGESLNVPLNNFSGKSDEKRIQGKSNGGGIPVTLSTSGNVSLSYN
jgi:hypothetical protein